MKFNIKHVPDLRDDAALRDIIAMTLLACDDDFVPRISERDGLIGFNSCDNMSDADRLLNVRAYADELAVCEFLLVFAPDDKLVGFMAYRNGYIPEIFGGRFDGHLGVYINMLAVLPEWRCNGIASMLYDAVLRRYDSSPDSLLFSLRMRGNHSGHMRLVNKFGFEQAAVLLNHRGPGLDTVYYAREVKV